MRYKIQVDEDAFQDIIDASLWYEEQSIGLGKRFRVQVMKQISGLKKNPLIFAVRYSDVFCVRVDKFPFLIHYIVEANCVYIYSVFHTSRNPRIWDKRTGII